MFPVCLRSYTQTAKKQIHLPHSPVIQLGALSIYLWVIHFSSKEKWNFQKFIEPVEYAGHLFPLRLQGTLFNWDAAFNNMEVETACTFWISWILVSTFFWYVGKPTKIPWLVFIFLSRGHNLMEICYILFELVRI